MDNRQKILDALKQIEQELTSMTPEAFVKMLDDRDIGDTGQFYLDTEFATLGNFINTIEKANCINSVQDG